MMIIILICALVFWIGFIVGFTVKTFLTQRFAEYNGTIVVDKDRRTEKIVYSLVLDDYPETLQFKKMVLFKVEQESDRD